MPRPNLYQSLHTTVIHAGQPFEVQIRTQEMHRIAEEGVAAHWKYKDSKPSSDDDQRITWMRQLIEWSQELQEPGEFLTTLKVDLAAQRSLRLHAQRPRSGTSCRRYACGFCLCCSTPKWPSVRWRKSERPHGPAPPRNLQAATWSKSLRKKATVPPRLAQLRKVLARQK